MKRKKKLIEDVFKNIEEKESEIIEFCQQLIKTPSQNGIDNEEKIARLISERLKKLKIKHELVGKKERPSIIAIVGKKGKRSFILNAHLDTVPIGDKKFWKYDPFSGKIVNGRLYGVGSADCKAGIAAAVYVANFLKDLNLNGKLILAFDSDEESGKFTGMKELLRSGLKGDFCLIAYPGNEELMIGSRGFVRLAITTFGKAAHTGSRKKEGINAISEMAKVIEVLENLKLKYKKDKFFNFGPKLTVSMIEGGTAINIVPEKCEIKVDIRILPSQTKRKIIKEIIQALEKKVPNIKFSLKLLDYWPAYRISEKEKIVKIILKRSKEILGKIPKISCSGATGIGNLLWQKKIPAICGFGPDFENAHSPNECVFLESLIKMTKLYAQIVYDFLKF